MVRQTSVLVTGAGSGIGRATTLRLAAEGTAVMMFDLDEAGLEETAALSAEHPAHVSAWVGDVRDAKALEGCVARAEQQWGALSGVVAAAGIVKRTNLLGTAPEDWDAVIGVNLTGTFNALRGGVPALIRAGGGAIVVVSSTAAHVGHGFPAYTASKGALISLARELAGELAPNHIRINSVSPGVVATPINAKWHADPTLRTRMLGQIPVGRFGEPADIAHAIAFLLGRGAMYVTGTDLCVDGGLTSTLSLGDAMDAYRNFEAHSPDHGRN